MTVHITNIRGMAANSVAQIAQNMVTRLAHRDLGFNVLSIYHLPHVDFNDRATRERLNIRFDGILASLAIGDTIIIQAPSWNTLAYDNLFLQKLENYPHLRKIIFVEDVPPLMFKNNHDFLKSYIDCYNQADVLILSSPVMASLLKKEGLRDKPIVYQTMWDHLTPVSLTTAPQNSHVINFAGDPKKFKFVANWPSADVKLLVFGQAGEGKNKNVKYLGWQNDLALLHSLHHNGGFGLTWSDDPYWRQYMRVNVSYKVSTYLAAGIPVIVNSDSPVKDIILQKHLGMVINNLDEAIEEVANISDFEYQTMAKHVASFAPLIRQGYFTKRALLEAICKSRI